MLEKPFAWSGSEDNHKEESGAYDELIEGRATDMENENQLWSQKAKNPWLFPVRHLPFKERELDTELCSVYNINICYFSPTLFNPVFTK